MQYLASAYGIARRTGVTLEEAESFVAYHRKIFHCFWSWAADYVEPSPGYRVVDVIKTWPLHCTRETKPGTVHNFPMQAGGLEVFRMACIYARQSGVQLLAPVHDGALLECAEKDAQQTIWLMQQAMYKASEQVLHGFRLQVDIQRIDWPNRFVPDAGVDMWKQLVLKLEALEGRRFPGGLNHNVVRSQEGVVQHLPVAV